MAFATPQYRNSAGRLHALLSSLNGNYPLGTQYVSMLFDVSTQDAEKSSDATKHKALKMVQELYLEVVDDIRELEFSDHQRTIILDSFELLNPYLYPTDLRAQTGPPDAIRLAMLSLSQSFIPQDDELNEPNELADISDAAAELMAAVENAQLPKYFRKFLLDLARHADDAVRFYKVYGSSGLKKAIKKILAEMAEFHAKTSPDEKEAAKESAVLASAQALCGRLAQLLNRVDRNSPWLLPMVLNLLKP